jgi:hypothetical protein
MDRELLELATEHYKSLAGVEAAAAAVQAVRDEQHNWDQRIHAAENVYRARVAHLEKVYKSLRDRARAEPNA